MSSGKVHTTVSLFVAGGFALAALVTADPISLENAFGALVGVFVQPDCDVDSGHIADKFIRQSGALGPLVEKVWDGVWYFYRKSVKHGSELSHFPIISTLGREAYFALFVIVIPTLLLSIIWPQVSLRNEWSWWFNFWQEHWHVTAGLMLTDTLHWALDLLTVEHKKK